MPNWCNNFVQIRHSDPAKLNELVESVRNDVFCGFALPCPQELKDTVAGHCGDGYAQDLNQAKMALNVKYFGAKDWYDWCVNRWGTKWEVQAYDKDTVLVDDGLVAFGFDSAWSPPIGVYEALAEQGFSVDAMYYEPGMGFCGRWVDGVDDQYNLCDLTSEQVSAEIDPDIDEQFGISETMAEYEAQEKDEFQEWYEDGVEKLEKKNETQS